MSMSSEPTSLFKAASAACIDSMVQKTFAPEKAYRLCSLPDGVTAQLFEMVRNGKEKIPIDYLEFLHNLELRELDLGSIFSTNDYNMDKICRRKLKRAFPLLTSLRIASLTKQQLSTYGVAYISKQFSEQLVSLSLVNCQGLTSDVLICLNDLRALKEINLEGCSMELKSWHLTQHLETVRLGWNDIHAEVLHDMIGPCSQSLKVLSLLGGNMKFLSAQSEVYESEYAYDPSILSAFVNLEELDIQLVQFRSSLWELVRSLQRLRTINASHNLIAKSLFDGLANHSLTSISLSTCRLGVIQLNQLLTSSNVSSLTYLDLSSNNFHVYSYDYDSAEVWTFASMERLKTLKLANCKFHITNAHLALDGDDDNRFALFPKSLIHLDLSQCVIYNSRRSDIIVNSLNRLSSLEELSVAGVTLEGSQWVPCLQNMTRLRVLDVSETIVTSDDIIETLTNLSSLTCLNIATQQMDIGSLLHTTALFASCPQLTSLTIPAIYRSKDRDDLLSFFSGKQDDNEEDQPEMRIARRTKKFTKDNPHNMNSSSKKKPTAELNVQVYEEAQLVSMEAFVELRKSSLARFKPPGIKEFNNIMTWSTREGGVYREREVKMGRDVNIAL